MGKLLLIGLIPAVLFPLGCAVEAGPGGERLYQEKCAACHGVAGAGDGELAGDLPVPPADLRGMSEANGGVFPAEDVMAAIYGYRGKDHDGLMPEFGPDLEGPTVLWTAPDGARISTPVALIELADHVETLQVP